MNYVTDRRPRRYVSSRRARQAEQTRTEIVAAAAELFAHAGWRATTVAAVAARAGVAIDTIYSGFGSKAGLLAAAKNAARDGDEAGVPYFDRSTFRDAMSGDTKSRLEQFGALLANLNARTWQLDAVWRDAAAFEPAVRTELTARELDRRVQFGRGVGMLLEAPVEQQAVDAVWVLTGSDIYDKLVNSVGLTHEQYATWLTSTLHRLLAPPASTSG